MRGKGRKKDPSPSTTAGRQGVAEVKGALTRVFAALGVSEIVPDGGRHREVARLALHLRAVRRGQVARVGLEG